MSTPDSNPRQPCRTARRWAFVAACLVTLIALFYAEENWRGRRAWEECRRALEAKGEVLDWAAHIPAPVPDDQNVFKAPRMQEWFARESFRAAIFGKGGPRPFGSHTPWLTNLITVAEVKVSPLEAPREAGGADLVLRMDDPASRERARELIGAAIGPSAIGPRGCLLLARPLDQVKPLRFVVQAAGVPSLQELAQFLPTALEGRAPSSLAQSIELRLDAAGTHGFRLVSKLPVCAAADYLAASDEGSAEFELLRQAFNRPLARMDGSYEGPFTTMPVVDFVSIRSAAQSLAQRAQCRLLLGQPEAAWKELALLHDLCRLLQARPIMLVAAMVDVAVTGVYTGVIADGLRLHGWREPQLAAIERQLAETNLLPLLVEAFKTERAASRRTFETSKTLELARLFVSDPNNQGVSGVIRSPISLCVLGAPRGWLYQNMVAGADLLTELTAGVDVTNGLFSPRTIEDLMLLLRQRSRHLSPTTFLAYRTIPNYVKAWQTTARSQTLLNEARVACALERYRLAQGHYPERLAALVPQVLAKLPHDLIGGGPLQYRRANDDQFVLYSIGWNQTDDGGRAGRTITDGDWVW